MKKVFFYFFSCISCFVCQALWDEDHKFTPIYQSRNDFEELYYAKKHCLMKTAQEIKFQLAK